MKKNIVYYLGIFALMLVCQTFISCSDDDEAPTDQIAPSATGTFTDERDGETYNWVRYGNLDWMAENYRYNLFDDNNCRLYQKDEKDIDVTKYGRLYTHTGALNACPEGWRLPTDEDWKNLEMQMGMSASDANKMDERGNIAMRMVSQYDNQPAINILLAGYYMPQMTGGMTGDRFLGAKGYYWTASTDTEKGESFYIFRNFLANSSSIRRQSTTNDYMMSVRYVRDAE